MHLVCSAPVTLRHGSGTAACSLCLRSIELREFTEIVSGSRPPRRGAGNCTLLTFDDADSEFLTAALPILHEQGLPGVIFAPTAYIGNANRFWHLTISSI